MSTEKERSRLLIDELLKRFNLTKIQLSDQLKYKSSSNLGEVYAMRALFNKTAKLFLKKDFQVNIEWLEEGIGEMFLDSINQPYNLPTNKGTIFPSLQKHGEKYAYAKDNLQILVVTVNDNNEEWVDVVPEKCLAGYAENGWRDQEFFEQLEKESIPEDLRGRGTIRKFQVDGHSMEEMIYHGDWVYCSYMQVTGIDDLRRSEFQNGYVFVLNTYSHGLILKSVWHKYGDSKIICESENEDQVRYAPFHVDLNDIKEWWYVRRVYTAKLKKKPKAEEQYAQLKYRQIETEYKIDQLTANVERIVKSLPTRDINLDVSGI